MELCFYEPMWFATQDRHVVNNGKIQFITSCYELEGESYNVKIKLLLTFQGTFRILW
jgi:hypothetical protein